MDAGNTWVDGACMTDEQLAAAAKAREATAIANAIAAAKTAVDGLTGASSDADIMAASNAITAAHNAITGAQHASAADTADSLDELDAIRMSLTTAQGTIDGHRQAAKAAANKVALSKKTAITAELNLQTDGSTTPPANRPFDGTAFDPADGADNTGNNYQVTVEHSGSEVEVTVVDGHADYDAKNDPMFGSVASFGNGQMLVRNDGTAREIIVLHTDIEAPVAHRFGTTASGYSLTVDVDTDTSANDSYVVLEADASKLGGSRIVSSDPGSKTLAQWEATGDNMSNVFAGTLDGAAGMFRCQTSGGCTITTADDDDNTVTIASGNVIWFTPNAGATVDIDDADYMTYGFWLDTTTKDGAIASYDMVQTFVTSSLPAATGTVATTVGPATYKGDAAGVYVHETKNEDSTLDTATSGRFTADVSLTAYFNAIANQRPANSLIGTISNFNLDGGPANMWNVDVSAGITSAFALENGVASGMDGDNGSLSGQFHHDGAGDTGAIAGTDVPGVLIGEFNANFVNGTVAGAYGARAE